MNNYGHIDVCVGKENDRGATLLPPIPAGPIGRLQTYRAETAMFRPSMSRELLVAIHKGTFLLKIKSLRALGFIKWPLPKLEVTADGLEEIDRLKNH